MIIPFETDQGIGMRANLGTVVLQSDETIEQEMHLAFNIDGVASYVTRIPNQSEVNESNLAAMKANISKSVELLPGSIDFKVISYACTSASTVIGSEVVAEEIQRVFPRVKVTNPIDAVIAACHKLNAHKIGLVTPYIESISSAIQNKLESSGLEVVSFGSFNEIDDRVVARITPESTHKAIETVNSANCDAIFVSCTNVRLMESISKIEKKIDKPVISSNLALLWHMLRLAGIEDKLNYSKLTQL